ncbi:MAG TPA: maleylpyruvate isomerase family mycothiol-dependent enzyme, partial [Acidimicrobiales bacterium]|nr:maleylpyruvate isomerase family mycothiol-dependent enzyme [Acidimicrobiales bacterium]
MDETVEALAAQHAELESLLAGLPAGQWHAATPCEGWDVADVVLHLTQSDELAIASATGRFDELASQQSGAPLGGLSVDESAALMVERERALPVADLLGRWTSTTAHLVELLDGMDLSTRVSWVAGTLSARTLATTRLAETWIHAGDIADALGRELAATDRLRLIARLAWRTLPYAFGSAGLTLRGPVALRLTSPSGNAWDFLP